MSAPATRRLDGTHGGALVETSFQIAERQPGEQPAPADASRVGALRRSTRVSLNDWGLTCLEDDAMLVVSELVTNAILHSGARKITLTLDFRGGLLRISVRDGIPRRPVAQSPREDEESGRGLRLVQLVAEHRNGSWGISDDGATTWCALSVARTS